MQFTRWLILIDDIFSMNESINIAVLDGIKIATQFVTKTHLDHMFIGARIHEDPSINYVRISPSKGEHVRSQLHIHFAREF